MSNETYAGFISAFAIALFFFFLFYNPGGVITFIAVFIGAAVGLALILGLWFGLTDIISSWFNGDL